MVDQQQCKHEKVDKAINEARWVCQPCGTEFVPMDAVQQIMEDNDRVLETVAAIFSGTLWDLHERAFEAHGTPMPHADPIKDGVQDAQEANCEESGHRFSAEGVCVRCMKPQFIGGGS